VLSGEGDAARSDLAMNAVLGRLADDEGRFIRLLTPPFDNPPHDPGNIAAYPPGVRENGGQYTHAAAWAVMALARMGRPDDAWRCFRMLNPISHSSKKSDADVYRVEPYVVAGDVYSEGTLRGRGGWTWYTGSAGWLYRVALEGILGLRVENGVLRVEPALPSDWPGFEAQITVAGKRHHVAVSRTAGSSALSVVVDGTAA
jgi:cyclic beta-1,2-glucan synthetase